MFNNKKILIITSTILPVTDANGLIALNLSEQLKKNGIYTHILGINCSKEEIDNENISTISMSEFSNKSNHFLKLAKRRINQIKKINMLPDFDYNQNDKVYDKLMSLHQKYNFDIIISMYKPYSNLSAIIKFKKENRNVLCCSYFLDFIHDIKKPFIVSSSYWDKIIRNAYNKVFIEMDINYISSNGYDYFIEKHFNQYRGKLIELSFPSFNMSSQSIVDEEDRSNDLNSNEINIIYAGSLNKKIRNPKKAIKILSDIAKKSGKKITLQIYGGFVESKIIKKYTHKLFYIHLNNPLKNSEIIKVYQQYDFILNLGNNANIDAIPSKIFELFSTGKPIINFSFKEDKSIVFFDKYPKSINIYYNDKLDYNKINQELTNVKTINVDKVLISELFKKNSIEYVTDLIILSMKKVNYE